MSALDDGTLTNYGTVMRNKSVIQVRNEVGNEVMDKILFKHRQPKVVTQYVQCNNPNEYEHLREPLFQKLTVKNNTLAKAKLFSSDGESVYLYRAMRKGQDVSQCMSWTFVPAVAGRFFHYWASRQFGKNIRDFNFDRVAFGQAMSQFIEDEFELRVMEVGLDVIEEVSIFSPNSEQEVLMRTNCAKFIELVEGCKTLKPSESMELMV